MLTRRQAQCMDFIVNWLATGRDAPSFRAIALGTGIALSQTHGIVNALERKGYIRRHRYQDCALEIVKRPPGWDGAEVPEPDARVKVLTAENEALKMRVRVLTRRLKQFEGAKA